MQFFDMYALRNGNQVAVVRPNKEALTFSYSGEHLHPAEHNRTLEQDTAAFIHVLNDIYQNRLFASQQK